MDLMAFFSIQGGIINKKLNKEQLEDHIKLIHEQYSVLEQFLTENAYIATNNVSNGYENLKIDIFSCTVLMLLHFYCYKFLVDNC